MSYELFLPGTGKPHEMVTIHLNTDTSGNTPAWQNIASKPAMAIRARGKEDDLRIFTAQVQGERQLYDEPGESWGDRMQTMREDGGRAFEAMMEGDMSAFQNFFRRTY